jgi:hypothetical protein
LGAWSSQVKKGPKEMIMGAEEKIPTAIEIERYFEQSPNAVSFYCDFAQVITTGNEVVIQLYETIPSAPDREGKITKVVTRLRATVTVSLAHAHNFGQQLIERTKETKSAIS